jgi:hypothetical protein
MAALKRAGLAGLVLSMGIVLSGCTSAAVDSARSACTHVTAGLKLYQRSLHESGSAATRDYQRAISNILQGQSKAGLAATQDGSWNALQIGIEEVGRLPLSNVAPALANVCQQAAQGY